MLSHAGVERVPQDARGAAAAHDLRARDDRGAEGPADGRRPLPPLRLPAPDRRADRQRAAPRGRRRGDRASGRRLRADRPPRDRLVPRRARARSSSSSPTRARDRARRRARRARRGRRGAAVRRGRRGRRRRRGRGAARRRAAGRVGPRRRPVPARPRGARARAAGRADARRGAGRAARHAGARRAPRRAGRPRRPRATSCGCSTCWRTALEARQGRRRRRAPSSSSRSSRPPRPRSMPRRARCSRGSSGSRRSWRARAPRRWRAPARRPRPQPLPDAPAPPALPRPSAAPRRAGRHRGRDRPSRPQARARGGRGGARCAPPTAGGRVDLEALRSLWPAVLDTVREQNAMLARRCCDGANPVELAGGELTPRLRRSRRVLQAQGGATPPTATRWRARSRRSPGTSLRLAYELRAGRERDARGGPGRSSDEELVERFAGRVRRGGAAADRRGGQA